MNLAVFGGSFDPVHIGHVGMVEHLLNRGLSDQVVLVPARRSPFKPKHEAATGQRLAMLELTFAAEAKVTIHTCELDRPAPSYTIDTLNTIAQEQPSAVLQLVVGQDNLEGLASWKSAQEILDLVTLIVFPRATGIPNSLTCGGVRELIRSRGLAPKQVIVCGGFHAPVSSREVRARLSAGESVHGFVPQLVEAFIRDQNLYTS